MHTYRTLIILLLTALSLGVSADTVKDLQRQQKKLQEEMEQTSKLLQQTKRNETATINKLELINKDIKTRRRLVASINDEISALDRQMDRLSSRRDTLERDLQALKASYAVLVLESHYARMQQSPLLFLISAADFNQLVRRMRYLQEFAEYRREQVERIEAVQQEIDTQSRLLADNRTDRENALRKQKREQDNLTRDEKKQKSMLAELKKKNKDLSAQLKKQQKKADELNKKIDRLIREQAQKTDKNTLTREQKLVAGGFLENKGRLPWPVEKGIISGHFGKHAHPVYETVILDNRGVFFQTVAGAKARAVYDGVVTACQQIGNTYSVIVQHGNYRSVYSNISVLSVKTGDKVKTKQALGTIWSDPEQDNKTELEFRIYEDRDIRNPELWLTRP